jgi:hypothetical protein
MSSIAEYCPSDSQWSTVPGRTIVVSELQPAAAAVLLLLVVPAAWYASSSESTELSYSSSTGRLVSRHVLQAQMKYIVCTLLIQHGRRSDLATDGRTPLHRSSMSNPVTTLTVYYLHRAGNTNNTMIEQHNLS